MTDPRYMTLFGACLTQFTVIGLLFAYGVFLKDIQAELGWSRTLLSGCTSLAFFMMGVIAILGGRLNDIFGPRSVLTVTGVAFGLGFGLLSQISAPWQLYLLFGSLIALGLGTHDVVTLGTIARWFDKRRGIMSGVVKLGTAGGQAVVPYIAALLLIAVGWRNAVTILGIAAAILLVIAAQAMRRPPQPAAHTVEPGLTYAEARKTRIFWTLCAIQFLFFPTLMTVPLHLFAHGSDLGLAPTSAAALLSVMGGASAAGRLIIGYLSDRIGGKNAYLAALGVLVAMLGSLAVTSDFATLFVTVALYGAAHGALFVVVSPTVARYFGMRAHGSIFGTVLFFGTAGGAFGPILAGWVFDTWASYTPAFLTLGIAAAIGFALTLSLPRPQAR